MRHVSLCYICVLMALLLGCNDEFGGGSNGPGLVLDESGPSYDDLMLVDEYIRAESPHTAESSIFQAGRYAGGWAVVSESGSVFWVSDGVVYVVNDSAKKTAPTLSQAPLTIQYDESFKAAVRTGI